MKNFFLAFIFFLSPGLGYAATVAAKGDILGDYEALTVTIVVSQVNNSSIKANPKSSDLLQNLSLYLNNSPSLPIQFETKKTNDPSVNNDFYWQGVGLGAQIEDDANNTKKITYTIQIFVNNGMSTPKKFTDADVNNDGVINLKIVFNKYNPADGTYSTGASQALTQGSIQISEVLTPSLVGIGYTGDDFATLTATIAIRQLSVEDPNIKPKAQPSDLLKNLSLYLNNTANLPIQFKTKNTKSPKFNNDFYWQPIGRGAEIVKDANGTLNILYTVQILVNTAMPKPRKFTDSDISAGGSIKLHAVFNKYNAADGTYSTGADKSLAQTEMTITKIYSSPNAAPQNFTIKPDHKSLVLSWNTSELSYLPAYPFLSQKPAKVLVMIFNADSGPVDLPASVASLSDKPKQILCKFDKSAVPCIQCPQEHQADAFINSAQPENEDVKIFTVQPNTGSYKVTDLEAHVEHIVVLQYERGVQRTQCLVEKPVEVKTFTEMNDAENKQGSIKGDPRCFIVSAAYGSPFDRHVDIFRWARDRFLNSFSLGRKLVNFYYEHSQPFADTIRNSPKLKAVVRAFLKPVAFLLYAIKGMSSEAFHFLPPAGPLQDLGGKTGEA